MPHLEKQSSDHALSCDTDGSREYFSARPLKSTSTAFENEKDGTNRSGSFRIIGFNAIEAKRRRVLLQHHSIETDF